MDIYGKIGTHPGSYFKVKYKRKLPIIGEKIKVKYKNKHYDGKYHECIIDDIDSNGIQDIYFMRLN